MSFQFSLTILDSLYLIISLSSSSVSFYQLNLSNICPKLLEITINKQFAETQIRAAGNHFLVFQIKYLPKSKVMLIRKAREIIELVLQNIMLIQISIWSF